MSPDPAQEEQKRKKSLRYSILDGSCFAMMDGFTSIFIIPFALFLKSSNLIISLLASVPDLFGSFFQLGAIKASELVKSRKTVIVISALMQAILWLPILLIPYFAKEGYGGMFLLIFMTLVASAGVFINPLWRSMMGDLVEEHERGKYFSKRNQITGLVSFLSAFIAGFILNKFSTTNALIGFTILFGIAIIARISSAVFLMNMQERIPEKKKAIHVAGLFTFLHNLPKNNYGRFVLFIFFLKIATAISSPFFAVYLLKHLHVSYWQFTILNGIDLFANLIFLTLWGKLNDEQGSKRLLVITGFLVPLIPIVFILAPNFWWLIAVHALSGAAWGGFNLAAGNFIFDATDPERRTRYVAYLNLLNGIGIFAGAMLGGLLTGLLTIKTVFVISGIARFGAALFLLPTLKEMRLIEVNFGKHLQRETLFIRPNGMTFQSISSYHPHAKPKKEPEKSSRKKPKNPDIPARERELLNKHFIENMLENAKKK
ncbi:MAG: MFS transporter [archaeon]